MVLAHIYTFWFYRVENYAGQVPVTSFPGAITIIDRPELHAVLHVATCPVDTVVIGGVHVAGTPPTKNVSSAPSMFAVPAFLIVISVPEASTKRMSFWTLLVTACVAPSVCVCVVSTVPVRNTAVNPITAIDIKSNSMTAMTALTPFI
jgi:hypothetical protein